MKKKGPAQKGGAWLWKGLASRHYFTALVLRISPSSLRSIRASFSDKPGFQMLDIGSGGGTQDGAGSQTGTRTGTLRQIFSVTQYGCMVQVVCGPSRQCSSLTSLQVVYGTCRQCSSGTYRQRRHGIGRRGRVHQILGTLGGPDVQVIGLAAALHFVLQRP